MQEMYKGIYFFEKVTMDMYSPVFY